MKDTPSEDLLTVLKALGDLKRPGYSLSDFFRDTPEHLRPTIQKAYDAKLITGGTYARLTNGGKDLLLRDLKK